MARENIYLGKRVKDTRKKGLDNLNEVRGIAKSILQDYRRKRISYKTATSRMNLLKLIVSRDSDFQSPKKKARAKRIVDRYRKRLMKEKRG
ncbi:MAG: hypothetical protein DRO40_06715 [Thermoprotei archaeon]|nr:MAG: hypothetical protein DRO40_06715 [Thermoprotei archaeon]